MCSSMANVGNVQVQVRFAGYGLAKVGAEDMYMYLHILTLYSFACVKCLLLAFSSYSHAGDQPRL